VVALPLLAVVRGVVLALMGQADTGGIAGVVGQVLASLGLVFGAVFFGFSVRYYLATITVLATTSLTGGRGDYHMHFLRYDEVPTHIAQKIIEETKKAREEEKAAAH